MQRNKSILNRLSLCFITVLILGGCKTLHPDLTHHQLMQKITPEAQDLRENYDFKTCEKQTHKFQQVWLNYNLWGKSRVKKGTPELCVYRKQNTYGWEWKVPEKARGVIGYPAIKIGHSPWAVVKQKIDQFPVRLDSISDLKITYETEQYVRHKKYNLAYDLWLVDQPYSPQKSIKTEIMIWEDYFDFKSYGKKTEKIITPFGVYQLYEGYLNNPKFKQDWQYIAFVRLEKRSSGEVDLKYLLDYLIKHQKIEAHYYLTSVEFGNEIGNSSGFTIIKKFEWIFNTNLSP